MAFKHRDAENGILKKEDWEILARLKSSDKPLSLQEIMKMDEQSDVKVGYSTSALAYLRNQGLINADNPDGNDTKFIYSLTPKGQSLLESYPPSKRLQMHEHGRQPCNKTDSKIPQKKNDVEVDLGHLARLYGEAMTFQPDENDLYRKPPNNGISK